MAYKFATAENIYWFSQNVKAPYFKLEHPAVRYEKEKERREKRAKERDWRIEMKKQAKEREEKV